MTPTPEEIKGKAAAMAMGRMGTALGGVSSSMERATANLASIKPETAKAMSSAFENIRDTNWDEVKGAFNILQTLFSQFGAFGGFAQAFLEWFQMMDDFIAMMTSDELKGLYEWLFSEEGKNNAKAVAEQLSELIKVWGKLDQVWEMYGKVFGGFIDWLEDIGAAIQNLGFQPHQGGAYGGMFGGTMSFGGMGIGGFSMPSLGSGNSKVLDNVTKSFW